jgi:hypothetical protein
MPSASMQRGPQHMKPAAQLGLAVQVLASVPTMPLSGRAPSVGGTPMQEPLMHDCPVRH